MASIKGISLRNFRSFEGTEGLAFSADIALDGKTVGRVVNDGWGGCCDYDWLADGAESAVKRAAVAYRKDPKSGQYDFLSLAKMGAKEYAEKEAAGKLPLITDPEELAELDTFMDDLINLKEDESAFRRGVRKGFKGIYIVRCRYINGPMMASDRAWFSNRPLPEKLAEAKAQYPSAYATYYCDAKQFAL